METIPASQNCAASQGRRAALQRESVGLSRTSAADCAGPPGCRGFEVKLVAPDGMVLWEGNYYEKQRPMTEDAWVCSALWTFVTAEELAAYGATELAEAFQFWRSSGEGTKP